MTTILVLLAAVLLLVGALYLLLCHEPMLAAWWYRIVKDPQPFGRRGDLYPPEAAEAPDSIDSRHDEYQRAAWFTAGGVPVVDGRHPKGCNEACCWEIRLTEMVEAFDWHAAEHEMRSKR